MFWHFLLASPYEIAGCGNYQKWFANPVVGL